MRFRIIEAMSAILLVGVMVEAARADVPRYKLEPGQEIVYRMKEMQKSDDAQFPLSGTGGSIRIEVLDKAKGGGWGGWKVAIVRNLVFWSAAPEVAEPRDSSEENDGREVILGILREDGRFESGREKMWDSDPRRIFAALPAQEGKDEYRVLLGREGSIAMKVAAKEVKEWRIEGVYESPQRAMFGMQESAMIHFDVERGLPTRIDTVLKVDGKQMGTGVIELVEVRRHDAAWVEQMARDVELFDTTTAEYEAMTENLPGDRQNAGEILDKARGILATAMRKMNSAELAVALKDRMQIHEMMARGRLKDAVERQAMIGKTAPEFSLERVGGGAKVSLKELRGKVLVLDFWYRRCGPCIAAMPELKQLVTDMDGKPVAVVGMNIDAEEKDAQFVVESLKLNYPSLRTTEEFVKQYGVTAFPTLIVINQQGVIRGVHVGVGITTRSVVEKEVEALLANPPK